MIERRKREVVLVVFPVNGIAFEVVERVVHPAHVPFEGKAQPAEIRRPRHLRPGGGFLGNGDNAGIFRVRQMIEFFHKFDRLQMFAPAELVGNPFARLARIVEVKHRGHGVHPQAVNVKAVEPEKRVGDKEIGNLMPAKIEDQRAPILMRALARVFVLVKGGAVEFASAHSSRGKCAGTQSIITPMPASCSALTRN